MRKTESLIQSSKEPELTFFQIVISKWKVLKCQNNGLHFFPIDRNGFIAIYKPFFRFQYNIDFLMIISFDSFSFGQLN